MDNERTAAITIGGEEYDLVLTTRATKQIAGRYGGLEKLGDKLMKSENFELAISEIVWLITLLANQSILIHNLRHADEKMDLLTEDSPSLQTPIEAAQSEALPLHPAYPAGLLTGSAACQRLLLRVNRNKKHPDNTPDTAAGFG